MRLKNICYVQLEWIKETEKNIWKDKIIGQIRELMRDFKGRGIDIISAMSWQELENIENEETLIITRTKEGIEFGKRKEIAVIGYEAPKKSGNNSESLYGADMIIQGFDEIDYEFVNRVYQRKNGIPWQILETDRCVIREICMDDIDELFKLYEDKSLTKYMEPLYERAKEEEYTRAYIRNMYGYYGYGMWLVFDKQTGRLIGRAGFNEQVIDGNAETELGYMIASDLQRQGYATEVCEAILAYGREYHEFTSVNCLIQPENTASIRLAEKLGMTYKGQSDVNGKIMNRYIINF